MEWNLRNKKVNAVILIMVILATVVFYNLVGFSQPVSENQLSVEELIGKEDQTSNQLAVEKEPEKEQVPVVTSIFVDVKGAVVKQGVYEIDSRSRVKDVIELAGGVTTSADMKYVNLAAVLEDEMVVYVPEIGEEVGEVTQLLVSDPKFEGDEKISINKATIVELQTLPGIGEAKAMAIIEFRERNGPFKSVDDLLQISGIGEKTLEKFRDKISVK
ncbi:helix-hairpin-helix domain-containing protein [Cytobacillus sp. S13-E01]|uniref:helix-hairpin-helix domain-containing protein n=1 Tax=Cytobacillus sp. S13-E01 TaxID=3031326 RepID=UPI0023D7B7BA|nr:helix-hairpin-helix domain-containing protein [Cytobacillus sp. S13-E01]MDF0728558.1 helix-hairpin-helix domain-containing protein [Cytobacillus sp. S13-E01]